MILEYNRIEKASIYNTIINYDSMNKNKFIIF